MTIDERCRKALERGMAVLWLPMSSRQWAYVPWCGGAANDDAEDA